MFDKLVHQQRILPSHSCDIFRWIVGIFLSETKTYEARDPKNSNIMLPVIQVDNSTVTAVQLQHRRIVQPKYSCRFYKKSQKDLIERFVVLSNSINQMQMARKLGWRTNITAILTALHKWKISYSHPPETTTSPPGTRTYFAGPRKFSKSALQVNPSFPISAAEAGT